MQVLLRALARRRDHGPFFGRGLVDALPPSAVSLGNETLFPPSFWRARVGNRGWDLWDGGRGTTRTNLVTARRGRMATLPDRLRGDPTAFFLFTGSGRCEVCLSTLRGIPKSKKSKVLLTSIRKRAILTKKLAKIRKSTVGVHEVGVLGVKCGLFYGEDCQFLGRKNV